MCVVFIGSVLLALRRDLANFFINKAFMCLSRWQRFRGCDRRASRAGSEERVPTRGCPRLINFPKWIAHWNSSRQRLIDRKSYRSLMSPDEVTAARENSESPDTKSEFLHIRWLEAHDSASMLINFTTPELRVILIMQTETEEKV
jgi:hypothetical protein